ncbi:hypothetical protein J6590_072281 [Homalodisca vitripennis]|nr:hypothetical protein J6590_072281 [Homalodisca vitripennis]
MEKCDTESWEEFNLQSAGSGGVGGRKSLVLVPVRGKVWLEPVVGLDVHGWELSMVCRCG